jgi:hypothetical protein
MIFYVIIKCANNEMTSMKYHDVESDDEINDDHHRVYSPSLREHVDVVIPVLSER